MTKPVVFTIIPQRMLLPLNSNAAGNIIPVIAATRRQQAMRQQHGAKMSSVPRPFFAAFAKTN